MLTVISSLLFCTCRFWSDKVKVEDKKIKISVGKDKSITISGDKKGKDIQGSIGFEWKFG